MSDTVDTRSPMVDGGDRMGDRIERVCHDIDDLLASLRDQARRLKEIGDDERR